ncbi:MAG: zinc ribbon domain-containing protein [Deltaproteobacteria bacterium]|nr:zinc ribbon domain-containing protein [Deltaproteobacteria bacterium]MBW2123024.1 zinc ribbon domain-containing protein [Deltaproteobacteria bacterium]
MIFIAGIQPKTKRLDTNPRICPSCGAPAAFLARIDHYLTLFFIPLFPVKRGEPVLICESCGAVASQAGEPLWKGGENRCPRCGESIQEGFLFCPYCGARLR